MAGHWLLRHECPAALLRAQEAFLAQDVNRLANGDARDRELTFQFDQRRNLLTGKPLLRLDAAAHDRGDLDVQRNAAAIVDLRYLQHRSSISMQSQDDLAGARSEASPAACRPGSAPAIVVRSACSKRRVYLSLTAYNCCYQTKNQHDAAVRPQEVTTGRSRIQPAR
jgi:hypothetical protein